MARGWESKSVEAQQQDAGRRGPQGPELSVEARARRAERETLRLTLASAQAELGAACRAAHRDQVRQRIAAIQEALARLPAEER